MKILYNEISSLFAEIPNSEQEELFQTLRETLYQMEVGMYNHPKTKALFDRYLSVTGNTLDTLEVWAMTCIFARTQPLEVSILAENFLSELDIILAPYPDVIWETPLIVLVEDVFAATFGVKNIYSGNFDGFTFTLEGATLNNKFFKDRLPFIIDNETCQKITAIAKSLEKEPN